MGSNAMETVAFMLLFLAATMAAPLAISTKTSSVKMSTTSEPVVPGPLIEGNSHAAALAVEAIPILRAQKLDSDLNQHIRQDKTIPPAPKIECDTVPCPVTGRNESIDPADKTEVCEGDSCDAHQGRDIPADFVVPSFASAHLIEPIEVRKKSTESKTYLSSANNVKIVARQAMVEVPGTGPSSDDRAKQLSGDEMLEVRQAMFEVPGNVPPPDGRDKDGDADMTLRVRQSRKEQPGGPILPPPPCC